MKQIKRIGLAASISAIFLATWGCTESRDPVEEALIGIWDLHVVSDDSVTDRKPVSLSILREDGWFDGLFELELTTDCGKDGLFGSWSGDWREVEVTLGRSPRNSVSGSLVTKCVLSVQPMSGYLLEAYFRDDWMVGKLTHQINRGGKWTGPMYAATAVSLFVGQKRPQS